MKAKDVAELTLRGATTAKSPNGDMDRLIAERIAQTVATFRHANERINAAAGAYGVDLPVAFICECADTACTEIVWLELGPYEEIRADPRHFFNVPGHHAEAQGAAVLVGQGDGYVIVETIGHTGEVVEALDERNADERAE